MIRKSFRFGLRLGLLVAVGVAIAKLLEGRRRDPVVPSASPAGRRAEWPPLQAEPSSAAPPAPAVPAEPAEPTPEMKVAEPPAAPAKSDPAWVEPTGEVCPASHPIKANMKSKIFHLPGMLNYDRTTPQRCYAKVDDAEKDGLRAAKR